MSRILLSSYRRRSAADSGAQAPVLWPRYLPGPGGARRLVMAPVAPSQIPAGWQAVSIRVPMRLASCEEVDCPYFLSGWNEVTKPDGSGSLPMRGDTTQDEAVEKLGLYGPKELAPTLVHHPAGTPCPRVHKRPSGLPPVYSVNGRTVLWNEFEDSLGSGLEHAAKLAG